MTNKLQDIKSGLEYLSAVHIRHIADIIGIEYRKPLGGLIGRKELEPMVRKHLEHVGATKINEVHHRVMDAFGISTTSVKK